jgi:hypothetical protein
MAAGAGARRHQNWKTGVLKPATSSIQAFPATPAGQLKTRSTPFAMAPKRRVWHNA